MSQLSVQTSHTPAFVRDFCTQRFMAATAVLDQIIVGGLELSKEDAKFLADRGLTVIGKKLVASVSERLKAIEMYGKFGPGIRTDHMIEDGPPSRSVMLMPPWEDDETEVVDVTETKGLPHGNGDGEEAR